MPSLNLESINESKNTNSLILCKNFLDDTETFSMSWEKIIDIFKVAQKDSTINFYSFATGSVDINKTEITKTSYRPIENTTNKIKLLYPGNMIASSLSVSFIGRDNSQINDDYQLECKTFFELHNNFKTPKILPNFADIKTPKFFYSVDTLFIQTNGTSSWKIDNPFPEEFVLNPGDAIFIPKKLVHSAEYLSPGSILSLSFAD